MLNEDNSLTMYAPKETFWIYKKTFRGIIKQDGFMLEAYPKSPGELSGIPKNVASEAIAKGYVYKILINDVDDKKLYVTAVGDAIVYDKDKEEFKGIRKDDHRIPAELTRIGDAPKKWPDTCEAIDYKLGELDTIL